MAAKKGSAPWNKGTSKGWINARGYREIRVNGRAEQAKRLHREGKLMPPQFRSAEHGQ